MGQMPPPSFLNVAVIGAGIGGLVAGRELRRVGHRVTIFEKQYQLGGTWIYDPRTESDPLSIDPNRERIHSSLYSSLRTNLPRHVMSFSDFSFTKIYEDSRSFPCHQEVLKFVIDFAEHFQLTELIRFGTDVVRVEQLSKGEWIVESRMGELIREEVFDAVVVCDGRHSEPRLANFPGTFKLCVCFSEKEYNQAENVCAFFSDKDYVQHTVMIVCRDYGIEKWPGEQIHSHNYRVEEPFRDKIVVIIGAGPSAIDISREIAEVAKEVHLSAKPSPFFLNFFNGINLTHHSQIEYVDETSKVVFEDGSSVQADVLFHCTGYMYSFPFLKTNKIITVNDNRVGPLYKHVFSPELGPRLSFVAIPYGLPIFPLMELQAKWISSVLSGQVFLPSKEAMMADTEEFYRSLEQNGIPVRHTHYLLFTKFEYPDWVADQVGVPRIDDQIKNIIAQLAVIAFGPEGHRFKELDVDTLISSTG